MADGVLKLLPSGTMVVVPRVGDSIGLALETHRTVGHFGVLYAKELYASAYVMAEATNGMSYSCTSRWDIVCLSKICRLKPLLPHVRA